MLYNVIKFKIGNIMNCLVCAHKSLVKPSLDQLESLVKSREEQFKCSKEQFEKLSKKEQSRKLLLNDFIKAYEDYTDKESHFLLSERKISPVTSNVTILSFRICAILDKLSLRPGKYTNHKLESGEFTGNVDDNEKISGEVNVKLSECETHCYTFKGFFKDGKPSGFGSVSDGEITFSGNFVSGLIDDLVTGEDNHYIDRFIGGYELGCLKSGTFFNAECKRINSESNKDNPHLRVGDGDYFYNDGLSTYFYRGNLKNGKCSGHGRLVYLSGHIYDGYFNEGKKEGRGIFYFPNGDRYEGEFSNNKRKGMGKYFYLNGDRYVGEYLDNKRHGKGKFYHSNGIIRDGNWKDHYGFVGTKIYPTGLSELSVKLLDNKTENNDDGLKTGNPKRSKSC